jgi:hypothetical protein
MATPQPSTFASPLSGDILVDAITTGYKWTLNFDRITDFSYAEGDRLKLEGSPSRTIAQVGADVVVDMGNGDQVILVGVSLASLGTGWIL